MKYGSKFSVLLGMDHRDTQIQELETLEAIYADELKICSEYPNIVVKISLQSHQEEENHSFPHAFSLTLVLQLSADYPDTVPRIEILGLENIASGERIEKMHKQLCDIAHQSLGMPMIFTIVSSLQDELGQLLDDFKAEKVKAEEKAKEDKEMLERKKFEGTQVTPETFLIWKKKFDAEMQATNEKTKVSHEAELARKLTGRQLFLRDATLNLSDVALMELAGSEIDFDESLFDEDIEDLKSDESD